jgi:hypothetical protein
MRRFLADGRLAGMAVDALPARPWAMGNLYTVSGHSLHLCVRDGSRMVEWDGAEVVAGTFGTGQCHELPPDRLTRALMRVDLGWLGVGLVLVAVVLAGIACAARGRAVEKRDARGRVRRVLTSRDLVARVRGVPPAELFPPDWGYALLEEAVAAGWPVELALVSDGAWHEHGRWSLVARFERIDIDGVVVPESTCLVAAPTRREVEDARQAAQEYLDRLDTPARAGAAPGGSRVGGSRGGQACTIGPAPSTSPAG